MPDQPIRSTKLKFKGEKTKKKRKREDGDERVGSSKRKADDKDPETWVLPESVNELRGPTFIVHPSDPSPISINYNSTTNRISLQSLDRDKSEETGESVKLLDRTPTDVSQVWVITRIAGSATINLRTGTGEGKFLSCDAHGLVSADRDARGPQEEWTPVVLPDGMVAFMNVYEKYLSVDETVGGILQLRGDSEQVGFAERFWVKVQYKYKREAHEEEKKRKDGQTAPVSVDESSTNRQFQAWGAGRSVVSGEDNKELKQARKEGRLAEAMLDRRAKLKRNLGKQDIAKRWADVRRHARGLDTLKPNDKQDPAKWANLVRKVGTAPIKEIEKKDAYQIGSRSHDSKSPQITLYKSGNDTISTTATPPAAGSGFPSEMDTNLNEPTPVGDEEEFEELLHIPPPALEDEVAMSKYSYLDFRTSLQHAMQLDDDFDDDLFGGLLDAMVEQSFRYFHEPAPDEALLRKVIEVISATNPGQFERYTNYWPIRVYLRWLQTNIPVIRPKYTEEEEANIYVDVFARYPGNRIDK
ncbi:hypothetical protein CVT25_006510 [Psilocybe cyanescens]|uniref:Uncharacterized protein n=1 Tax=Psilocybe cyanescens TaxID=93625 RepID=A0A409XEC6_PSICY|nr:hypothetical protein CVT25_006510 [Psilocybe cyanescens]